MDIMYFKEIFHIHPTNLAENCDTLGEYYWFHSVSEETQTPEAFISVGNEEKRAWVNLSLSALRANFLLLLSQVLASYHSSLVGFDGGKSCTPTNYEFYLIFSPSSFAGWLLG